MKSSRITFLLAAIPTFVFVLLSASYFLLNTNSYGPIVKSRLLMGTVVEITVSDFEDVKKAKIAIEKAFEEIERIEKKFNVFDSGSQVSRLNRLGHEKGIKVDDEVLEVVEKAIGLCRITDGAYDITVKPLLDVWRISEVNGEPPKDEDIMAALTKVDSQNIVIDRARKIIGFSKPGMEIDMSGIVKGYAVDRAITRLRESGVENAIVNAGGDIYCLGRKNSREKWTVGIRDPRARGKLIGKLKVSNVAVDTSGDYERFIEIGNRRYSHIVNPKTGKPVGSRPASITIVARDSMTADALATALMVMDPDSGMRLIEALEDVDAIILTDEEGGVKIYASRGIKEKYGFKEM